MPVIEEDGTMKPLHPRRPGTPKVAEPCRPRHRGERDAGPPSPSVRARDELTPASLARRARIEADGREAEVAERLLERQKHASRSHAGLLADLATLWVDRGDAALRDDREEMDLVAAIALRTTTSYAASQLRDAHLAVTDLPETYRQLAAGAMPIEWFDRLVRAVRDLSSDQRAQIDQRVALWDLASIPADRYRRELRQLVAWFASAEDQPSPESRRDVTLETGPDADGTACVTITGPIPELMSLTRRLDQSARAVQDQQRRALARETPVPFDPEGVAAASGRPLPLATLRYAILTGSVLDTGAIEVPAERFRINVVVPMLTLMGASQAPATLEGTVPIPAAMARALAGGQETWHRILSDPITGTFLPLPAEQYRPPKTMLEYLRLADPVCAVPGCDRVSSCNCEGDHIITFNHLFPEKGGRTCLSNLHMLCRTHHRMKTLGLLDVERLPAHVSTGTLALTGAGTAEGSSAEGSSAESGSAELGAAASPRCAAPPGGEPPGTQTRLEGPDPTGRKSPPGGTDPPQDPTKALTRWKIRNALQVDVNATRDLLTPEIATALHEAWEEHQWRRHVQHLLDSGEVDRMFAGLDDPALGEPHLAVDDLGRRLDLTPPF